MVCRISSFLILQILQATNNNSLARAFCRSDLTGINGPSCIVFLLISQKVFFLFINARVHNATLPFVFLSFVGFLWVFKEGD